MKAFLMYKDRDFNVKAELPPNEESLMQDLELDTLLNAMSMGDNLIKEVAKVGILSGLSNSSEVIVYRQSILRDSIKNGSVIREIYKIAVEAMELEKKHYFWIVRYPGAVLTRSVEVMHAFIEKLVVLKNLANAHSHEFVSEGFQRFFNMVKKELEEQYFNEVRNHLKALKFKDGVLISAQLGKGNKGQNYVLRKNVKKRQSLIDRILKKNPPAFTFTLHPRDESGARALSELSDRGINLVANALAQSNDHILSFFTMVRAELGFYIGCLNLYEESEKLGLSVCWPDPVEPPVRHHSFDEMYDICLALTMKSKIVGNKIDIYNKRLYIITGANQGGKSTFLRSIGLSQLMMQAGMFVPAVAFSANTVKSIFTHYKREEDTAMKSGKLDEELKRMSDIVKQLTLNTMILFNESFSATNEREGSEIARQIVKALLEHGIIVFFVTHLFELADYFYQNKADYSVFLRAERQPDGNRTYRLEEGRPLQTSFGEDLYRKIFQDDQSQVTLVN